MSPTAISLACLVTALYATPTAKALGPARRTSHLMRLPGAASPMVPAANDFTYQGGPLISHVQVVAVLWGDKVASLVTMNVANFFTVVTNSAYMDWMGEYDSAGHSGGTNQHISHGTFLKTVTIMPAKTTGTITDGDIQAALKANLASGVLPAPMRDPVEGQVNTLYMVYFPPGLIIDDGTGSKSCTGWWAYHGALSGVSGVNSGALYGVIPDFSTGRCSMGCGGNNVSSTECMTCTSAHELLEAMSDADNPPGWSDNKAGEICDVCNTCETVAGVSVQQCWSKRLGKCIATDPNLPLCDGTKRPCRSCGPGDCSGATPLCVTDPLAPNAGQCIAGLASDGGSGSGGSSDGGGRESGSTSGSGGGSGSTSSDGGSDSTGGGGGNGAAGNSDGGSGGGGGGSSASGGASGGVSGGTDASVDARAGDNLTRVPQPAGCACVIASRASGPDVATSVGLLFAITALGRCSRRRRA